VVFRNEYMILITGWEMTFPAGCKLGDEKLTIRGRRCRHSSICARRRRKRQHRASTRATPPAVPRVHVTEGGAPGVEEAARCGDVAAAEDTDVDAGALGAV
jgi:hypothetical protein